MRCCGRFIAQRDIAKGTLYYCEQCGFEWLMEDTEDEE